MLVPKAAVMHDTLTCEPHIGTCGFYPLNNTKKQTNTLLKTFPLNPQTKNIEGFSHTPAHPSHATRGALFWHTLVSPSCQTHPFWQGVCATLQKPVQPLLPRGICCISLLLPAPPFGKDSCCFFFGEAKAFMANFPFAKGFAFMFFLAFGAIDFFWAVEPKHCWKQGLVQSPPTGLRFGPKPFWLVVSTKNKQNFIGYTWNITWTILEPTPCQKGFSEEPLPNMWIAIPNHDK